MKRNWLWKCSILVTILGTVFVFGREVLAVRLAPKAVLYSSLVKMTEQLKLRVKDSPLEMLLDIADPEGKYTADISLQAYANSLVFESYKVKIQTNAKKYQVFADGLCLNGGNKSKLSCYLDQDFISFSTDKLAHSRGVGIVFSSFSNDIQKIPLIDYFVSDQTIAQWDEFLQGFPIALGKIMPILRLPRISGQNINNCILGVLALPCKTEYLSLSIEGELRDCVALTYSAKGEQINYYLNANSFPKTSEFQVTFYLYKNALIKTVVKYTAFDQSLLLEGFFGQDSLNEEIRVCGTWNYDDITNYFTATIDAAKDESPNNWNMKWIRNAEGTTQTMVQVSFLPDTGCMYLSSTAGEHPISFYLQKRGESIYVKIEDLEDYIGRINPDFWLFQQVDKYTAEILLYRGSEIIKPKYKKLDEWSLEDFWSVLTDVGSFLGIQIM